MRSADTVSRLGGDEFVVLLEGVDGVGRVVDVVGRVAESLGAPFAVEGGRISVSASIGVALDGVLEREAEDLVREADRAMYRAKQAGGGRYEVSGDR